MMNLGLIYTYCAIVGRIDALRRAGQAGRADGAQMFLEGAFELLTDVFFEVEENDEQYDEVSYDEWPGEFRLVCARYWLKGGERLADDVTELGASTKYEYEVRDPQGDLVYATDDSESVGDWILAFVDAGGYEKMREQFDEDAPNYTVFYRQGGWHYSIGYIHRVALGG